MAAPGHALLQLAAMAGLAPSWQDVFGEARQVSEDSLRYLLAALGFPCESAAQIRDSMQRLQAAQALESDSAARPLWILEAGEPLIMRWRGRLPYRLLLESGEILHGTAARLAPESVRIEPIAAPGYHTLDIGEARLRLAVCPARCPAVPARSGGLERPWGITAQVYSLHGGERPSQDKWGVAGDFATLADFAARAGKAGASALAISPVHALFGAAPERYSPYAPSSRLFLNAAYAEPALVCGSETVKQALGNGHPAADAQAQENAGATRPAAPRIDWPALVPARLAILRRVFEHVRSGASHSLQDDFQAFRKAGGEALERHARYEALHAAHRGMLGADSGWQDWPGALHDPSGAAVRRFAQAHQAEVEFQAFLQWLADRGLRQAQQAALGSGMPIGLIIDLAIGTDPRGSHAWSRQADLLQQVSIGAPPDLFQPQGQNWGITAFSPYALRDTGYAAYIETLRANFRHAGGVRIDHIIGLARMWLIAAGAEAHDGAYLRYPLDDMLRLLMLEAWRHQVLVIGENLGTVAPGFNDMLRDKGILGTSVLWFELQGAWPDWSMATTSTHDLPTIEGWWSGRDIGWRWRVGQLSADQAQMQHRARSAEKVLLAQALGQSGGIPSPAPRQDILAYVAATSSPLVVIPAEDLLGVAEQPNLPGFDVNAAGEPSEPAASKPAHPSWIQVLPTGVDAFFDHPEVARSLNSIRRGRRQGTP
ncbi:4-alpha-glucanotransferase [Pusillimonas sp. SM2304]|uniref:4-alpha-glucanotransferase n=1 Tax=Pusillimonas sp. SM2304 TaxID=3073241 RepID=UPI002875A6E4|nr:4-alpha-glucanotransferase [Pusillimonas sp. SM2304]MDS1141561.1 4-alpha-glucanotransferase [Pusillimonas sp. SM2304]